MNGMIDNGGSERPFLAGFPAESVEAEEEPVVDVTADPSPAVKDVILLMSTEQFDHRPESIETLALAALGNIEPKQKREPTE